eukprot:CAMPEP_0201934696 /NCGR_PEP_ID=MMETSP0903-20130614/34149_1 /ASSEMBLY_ACC=CAM_ASM_000552 /TAXON_ID=420261 /ORGANISM="Thalassiosira antarctica, Strain CCMP982" /LENGTH=80 /DNA_ID=CAMNT_0048474961 /DNA_START=3 /DNA_END=242 /DNA_ORIENTATION=-
MTSILSAAGYSRDKSERKKQSEQQRQQNLEESATKKALRLRASKYFRRGGSVTKIIPTPPTNHSHVEEEDDAKGADRQPA